MIQADVDCLTVCCPDQLQLHTRQQLPRVTEHRHMNATQCWTHWIAKTGPTKDRFSESETAVETSLLLPDHTVADFRTYIIQRGAFSSTAKQILAALAMAAANFVAGGKRGEFGAQM